MEHPPGSGYQGYQVHHSLPGPALQSTPGSRAPRKRAGRGTRGHFHAAPSDIGGERRGRQYTIPSPALLCGARLRRGRLGGGLGEGLEGTYTPRPWTSEENVAADMLHLLCLHYISMGRVHEHVYVGVLFAIFWCEFENPFMNPNTNRMLCACEHDLMRAI